MLWTDTYNLATEDPEMAWRIMAATAKDALRIQRDHHDATAPEDQPFKASRRSFNHVFHYSLSWRGEDEAIGITRAEMIQCAKDSLHELGGADLQALFVAHEDTDNPHVHIMVNRIHPETGRVVGVDGNSKKRLSNWARHYERDRNLIVCPERERRAHLREAGVPYSVSKEPTEKQYRDQAAVVDAVKADPNRAAKVQAAEQAQDSVLHRDGIQMRARHQAQWEKLSRDHGFRKRLINDEADSGKREATRQVGDRYIPRFEAQWDRQREEVVQFHQDEQRFLGRFSNRLKAVKSILGQQGLDARERFQATFSAVKDEGARLAALEMLHRKEDRLLKGQLKADTKSARAEVEQGRKTAIDDNYQRFVAERETMRDAHQADRRDHKRRWDERDRARTDRWEAFAVEVEAERDMRAAYEDAKGEPFRSRATKEEDQRRSEAEANRRTEPRSSKDDFDLSSGESLADQAARQVEPPREAFKDASQERSGPKPSADD
ncbi:MAG: relaxase/mobilization nuclease domain-containing protein [Pseudomonadota bacterium]